MEKIVGKNTGISRKMRRDVEQFEEKYRGDAD